MTDNIKRCTKCVLSASFPNINFDENGVCNFCRDEMYHTADEDVLDKSKEEIIRRFESGKGKSQYDAVMCYSGGKDSTYTLMLAVEKYGLNVLAFTFDNGFISPVAFENINRVAESLNVDLLTIRPSLKFMKKLIRASSFNPVYTKRTLTRISSNCNSCITMVNILALRMALEKKIPFILAGFTLGQIPLNTIIYKNNYRFFQDSRKPILDKLRKAVGDEIDKYMCIDEPLLDSVTEDPYNVNLLCIEEISEEKILEKIRKTGWTQPEDVDGCSSNCRLNAFNNFIHEQTLGYNPYELELSHLIKNDLLTREEALEKIQDKSETQVNAIIEELNITPDELSSLKEIYKKK
ncbi:MAG: 7-cyano-7-deazaguanine synthase [Spirochaetes bacterium]|nr:7-cyano-7-deazaguanine synthase [Spirochaetota bacterium]